MEWNNWTIPELPWKLAGRKNPDCMKALSSAMQHANLACGFWRLNNISPRDVLQWMSIYTAMLTAFLSVFLFVCLDFFVWCGVFVLFWIFVFWYMLLLRWLNTHSCKDIAEKCILMGSSTTMSVHMSPYLWKGCFSLLPWLDTVYCPAEDGLGGTDFHLCKICPCCSLQLGCWLLCVLHREKHRTAGYFIYGSIFEQQSDFDSVYHEDHGHGPL